MNKYSFVHPNLQCHIFAAMQKARILSKNKGLAVVTVKNRHGKVIFTCRHNRGSANAFVFQAMGKDITKTVLSAIRG